MPIAYASETGFVEEVAERTQKDLQAAGVTARLLEFADLDARVLATSTRMLFVVSTTGDGDPPLSAEAFSEDVMDAPLDLSGLQYGLLSAGDSGYPEFCGFGHRLHAWLQHSGACAWFEPVEVDCEDDTAVQRWRRRVRDGVSRDRPPQRRRS